jgi:hypothetical protein
MREWLQERFAAAKLRNAAARRARPSGYGVTERMISISAEAARREPEWVVRHEAGKPHVPYVNLARDFKPGRRLRPELRERVQ